MKKIILLCLLSLAALGLKGQTLEQTTEYIQATVQPYLGISSELSCAGDSIKSYKTITHFKDLKGVNYIKVAAKDNFEINLTGKCYYDFNHNDIMNNNHIFLDKNTPVSIVEKLIKAIKHAAELQGAKLVNENMF